MKFTIVVAAGLYPPDIGGPATYARMLEEELPERGVGLTVVPFGSVRQYPKVVRHVVYAWRLWRHAKHADLIYALDPISVGVPAYIASRLSGIPYLVRLGGDYAWEQGQQRCGLTKTLDEYTENPSDASRLVKMLAAIQTFVCKRAQRVIVPSEYLKSIVATWGVEPERLVRIYSTLHPLVVPEDRDSVRAQLAYTSPTIITAARLVPWKGVRCLIDVVGELQTSFPDVTLVVAGDGTERRSLEAYAKEQGMNEQVRFVGQLSKEALGAAIFAADGFVLNTAYEGLSHQLLEVMELEVPIVTTAVGGNVELIEHEHSGLFVPYNDKEKLVAAITAIVADQARAAQLTTTAKQKTASFRHEVVIKELLDVFREVTNQS